MKRHASHAGLAALTLIAGLLTAAPAASAASTTFPFAATQDSYVSSASPNANFNSTNSLAVGAAPVRISYLQFTVSRLVDPVSSALLRLHVQNTANAPSPNGGTAQEVGTS